MPNFEIAVYEKYKIKTFSVFIKTSLFSVCVKMKFSLIALLILSAVSLWAENICTLRDCQDVQKFSDKSGVYTIYPEGTNGVKVRCDMETDGGGWTVIQRRINESDFFKDWNEYQIGFGDPETNYWLGNENIYRITKQGSYELRVDLSYGDETAYAGYNVFFIGNAKQEYELFVDGYHGTAGDGLSAHKNHKFSTLDRDNDEWEDNNCAITYVGGWWYYKCHSSNLNGRYGDTSYAKGPVWEEWKGYYKPMDKTEMKIRRL